MLVEKLEIVPTSVEKLRLVPLARQRLLSAERAQLVLSERPRPLPARSLQPVPGPWKDYPYEEYPSVKPVPVERPWLAQVNELQAKEAATGTQRLPLANKQHRPMAVERLQQVDVAMEMQKKVPGKMPRAGPEESLQLIFVVMEMGWLEVAKRLLEKGQQTTAGWQVLAVPGRGAG